jgi:glucokinase
MAERFYAGIDIGGTKTTTIIANPNGDFLEHDQFPTTFGPVKWQNTVVRASDYLKTYANKYNIIAIGLSCGGPVDIEKGLILSPPNLPGWDEVPIVDIIKDKFHVPVYLENDANAGALAEWKYGAGKGLQNLIFLTFGTGLGAGLILNGRLYYGTSDLAGEAGHIRLAADGPLGHNKHGSFEGFCSGRGLAQMMAEELRRMTDQEKAHSSNTYPSAGELTGKTAVDLAGKGDNIALRVVERSGNHLGKGLAILIDLVNPEMIVVGSMGYRLGDLLLGPARTVVSIEALPTAATACKIVPSALGEQIGDYAAFCTALQVGKD